MTRSDLAFCATRDSTTGQPLPGLRGSKPDPGLAATVTPARRYGPAAESAASRLPYCAPHDSGGRAAEHSGGRYAASYAGFQTVSESQAAAAAAPAVVRRHDSRVGGGRLAQRVSGPRKETLTQGAASSSWDTAAGRGRGVRRDGNAFIKLGTAPRLVRARPEHGFQAGSRRLGLADGSVVSADGGKCGASAGQ